MAGPKFGFVRDSISRCYAQTLCRDIEIIQEKGRREVHGASSRTLKVNAVQVNSYEGHSTGLAQGCRLAKL
jgi:hypothetical protein